MFYGVMAFGLTQGIRLGYRFLYSHPTLAVSQLHISGASTKTEAALRGDLAWVLGRNILSLDLREVHQAVQKHPFVASNTVTSELPDRLRIAITEHEPAALARHDSKILAVNKMGEVIGPFEDFPSGLDLPVLEGVLGSKNQRSRMAQGIQALATIQKTSLLFWDNLETLNLSDPHNMVAHLRSTTSPIMLGSEVVTKNLKNYLAIAEIIQTNYPQASYVELGFPGQISVGPQIHREE